MSVKPQNMPQFYITSKGECPYLDGEEERKLFTHLVGPGAPELNNMLAKGGFRRTQNIAYKPACENCDACQSMRVPVDSFKPSKNHKRIISKNRDVSSQMLDPEASTEQYELFRDYIDSRHNGGGMCSMTLLDYAAMIEDSFVDTRLIEYRLKPENSLELGTKPGPLLATALIDMMDDGLSMIYSFFDVSDNSRSLGTYMILDHIERTRKLGLPYLYLGFWVKGSPKMDYKARFKPLEILKDGGGNRL